MSRQRALSAGFFVGLGGVLVCILAEILPSLLPTGLASSVAYNSEGYLFALLLALWIQCARSRLRAPGGEWPVTTLAAAASMVVGIALFRSDLPSRFKTLNETFIAVSLIVLYMQVRRPMPRWVPIGLSLGVLATIVFANGTDIVTDLAETLGMLLLVPLAFDVVDRGILDPAADTSAPLRYSWYALLVVVPVTFSVLLHFGDLTGLAYEITRYDVRMHEAFVGMLLGEIYFAVGLGWTGTELAARGQPGSSPGDHDFEVPGRR